MTKKNRHASMIDMEIMYSVFGQNRGARDSYIESFIEITTATLQDIERAIQQKNSELVKAYLHKLKGPMGSSGFKKMYQLCEKAEEKMMELDWLATDKLCQKMKKLLKKLQIEIKILKNKK